MPMNIGSNMDSIGPTGTAGARAVVSTVPRFRGLGCGAVRGSGGPAADGVVSADRRSDPRGQIQSVTSSPVVADDTATGGVTGTTTGRRDEGVSSRAGLSGLPPERVVAGTSGRANA